MTYDVVVVGAGLAGCTAARIAAEKDLSVLLLERRDTLGGNCYDELTECGITIHRYGPHIFHTNDADCWAFVNRFARFSNYEHKVISSTGGVLYPFPVNRKTISMVFGRELHKDEIPALLAQEVANSSFFTPPRSFRDVVVSQVGERLYDTFYRGYTAKQWGQDPDDLLPELAGRIPIRHNDDDRYFTDAFQGLPVDGYTKMVQAMLSHDNITIRTGVDYLSMPVQPQAPLTVYTGPLDAFFDFAHGKLSYRSMRMVYETHPVEQYGPGPVVNYPNDHEWVRTTEYKLMTGDVSDSTIVCKEIPTAQGEPFYVVPDTANRLLRDRYWDRVQELEAAGTHLFVGRLAEYRYYNMDGAIIAARDKICARL